MSRSWNRALLLWLCGSLLAGAYLWRNLQLQTDISSLLPQGASPTQRLLLNQLRAGTTMRLLLLAVEGGDADQLAAASRFLKTWMQDSKEFTWVANGDDAWSERDRDLLLKNRYLLSAQTTVEAFSVAGLRAALQQRLADLASPLGMMSKGLLGADPTGAFLSLVQSWQPGQSPAKYRGVWLTPDPQRALLTAETLAAGYAFAPQQALQTRMRNAFLDYAHNLHQDQLRLVLSGPAVFTVKIQERIETDAWRLSLLASAMVIVFLGLTYRSLRVLGLSLVPLLSAILGGLCAVNLVFGFVHGITLAFGITLLGVVDDYPIHLFSHMSARQSAQQVMREIWPTMRLGILTTAIGFAALLFAPFPGLQHLGVFAVSGLLVAGVVTRYLLPELVPESFRAPQAGRRWPKLTATLARMSALVVLVTLASALLLASSGSSVWEQDVDRLTPLAEADKATDQALRHALGAPDVRYLLAALGKDPETVLRTGEQLGTQLEALVKTGELSGYEAAHRYLPSQHTQRKRQGALPETAGLEEALTAARDGLPFKPGIFAAFFDAVAAAKKQPLLNRDSYQGTVFGTRLNALLTADGKQWLALIPLQGVRDPEKLRADFNRQCSANCVFLDLKAESNLMVTGFRNGALEMLACGGLAIVLILGVSVKNIRQILRIMAPMLSAIICLAAVLHLLGEHLSLFHIAAFLLVIGLGLDYALFFNHPHSEEEDLARTSYGLLVCSTTTILVFGILACSTVPALRSIGLTAALGSALSLLFAAMLAKPERLDVTP